MTAPDSTFHGPQHPQPHPSWESRCSHSPHPAREPGPTVLFRAPEALGNPRDRLLHVPANLLQKTPVSLPWHQASPAPTPTSPNLALGLRAGARPEDISLGLGGCTDFHPPPKLKPPFPAHRPSLLVPGNRQRVCSDSPGSGEQEAKNKLCRREGVRETTCNTRELRREVGGLWERPQAAFWGLTQAPLVKPPP